MRWWATGPWWQIQNGKAVIVEFKNIPEWWGEHSETMIKHFEAMGEMWYQRA